MKDILDTAAEVAERLRKTAEGTPDCEVPRNPKQAREGYEALTALIDEVKRLTNNETLAEHAAKAVCYDDMKKRAEAAGAKVTNFCRIAEESAAHATAAEAALTACEAERDELAAQLVVTAEEILRMRGPSRDLVAGELLPRAQTMKAVVDVAVKWFVNPTMSEGSLALEDAIIAHQQQEPKG